MRRVQGVKKKAQKSVHGWKTGIGMGYFSWAPGFCQVAKKSRRPEKKRERLLVKDGIGRYPSKNRVTSLIGQRRREVRGTLGGGCLFLPFLTYCTPLMPAITNWTSFAVVQLFVAEIPFIAEFCRRDRLTKELGLFFPDADTLAGNQKILLQNVGAQEEKPQFSGGGVAYLGAELQFSISRFSWNPFRNVDLHVQPDVEVEIAACRQAIQRSQILEQPRMALGGGAKPG